MNILIIEDNKKMAENIAIILRHDNYIVNVANEGSTGISLVKKNDYDLIILDLSLPDIDGLEICKILRNLNYSNPIIMLTARIGIDDKVRGLDNGADDYLVKPFLMEELLARIRSLLRRNSEVKTNVFNVSNFEINLTMMEVKKDKKVIHMSIIEIRIIEFLLLNLNKAKTFNDIYNAVWGSDNDKILFSGTLRVHISRIRKKLLGGLIETVPGWGYIIKNKQL